VIVDEIYTICVDRFQQQGDNQVPTAAYGEEIKGFKVYEHSENFHFHYGGILPEVKIAYETWGTLNEVKDNAIILHGGLSASSHAKSHPVSYECCINYYRKPLKCDVMCYVMFNHIMSC